MNIQIFINMENKLCICCKLTKDVNEFHKNKSKKDGLQDHCKVCRNLKSQQNKEKRKEYRREWYLKNLDKVKSMSNLRYQLNKDDINEKKKETYRRDESVRLKYKQQQRKYYENNKELFFKQAKLWTELNRDRRNEISKKHYNEHKTLMICRRLIKRTLKYLGTEKESTTIELLGYSPSQLKETIESKFVNGMSWSNYGEWHIDHIRPISSFNKTEHPKVVNSLDNLQPLWAFDNLSKGCKFVG
jgi:hypothetical protein